MDGLSLYLVNGIVDFIRYFFERCVFSLTNFYLRMRTYDYYFSFIIKEEICICVVR